MDPAYYSSLVPSPRFQCCTSDTLQSTLECTKAAVDCTRIKQELDELSRELESVKQSHLQLRFGERETLPPEHLPNQIHIRKRERQGEEVAEVVECRPRTAAHRFDPANKENISSQLAQNVSEQQEKKKPAGKRGQVPEPKARHETATRDPYLRRLFREHAPQKAQSDEAGPERNNECKDDKADKKEKGVLILVGESGGSPADKFPGTHKAGIILRHERPQTNPHTETYRPRSSQEILSLRRKMMKSTISHNPPPSATNKSAIIPSDGTVPAVALRRSSREPPRGLLERLSNGEKARVDRREMIKLTRKNYEMLPEVVRKRREEEKRLALVDRLKHAKEFEKVGCG